MSSSERVLQAAVHAALTGNAAHAALVSGVFDGEAPQGQAYPYTTIGAMTETPAHAHDKDGWSHTLTIHDWDGGARSGRKRLQQVREAASDVLHHQVLTVAGWGLTKLTREFADVLVERDEADRPVFHQVTRWRADSLES